MTTASPTGAPPRPSIKVAPVMATTLACSGFITSLTSRIERVWFRFCAPAIATQTKMPMTARVNPLSILFISSSLRFLIGSRFDLFDHRLPVFAHPRRLFQAVEDIRSIGPLQVEHRRDHLFLIKTCFSQRNARGFSNEGRAARSLFSIGRLADGVCNQVEDLGVRADRLLGATREPFPGDGFDLI